MNDFEKYHQQYMQEEESNQEYDWEWLESQPEFQIILNGEDTKLAAGAIIVSKQKYGTQWALAQGTSYIHIHTPPTKRDVINVLDMFSDFYGDLYTLSGIFNGFIKKDNEE